MNLLAVDTSGVAGSIAIVVGADRPSRAILETTWVKKAMHSEVATVELQSLLDRADLGLKDLTHLAVNVGPGSFTGLRVGISLVKTLAYSLSLPVASCTTLEILAHAKGRGKVFVATKAVQNFFYFAGFDVTAGKAAPLTDYQSAPEPDLARLSAGYDQVFIESKSEGFQAQTSAKVLLDLLLSANPPRDFLNWKFVEPLYIRASEAEEKLKKKGLLR